MNYYNTPLEDYIKQLYNKLSINHPSEFNKNNIADTLNFKIYYIDMKSTVLKELDGYHMAINRRLSLPEQWEDFGHELGHMLRQAGKQMKLDRVALNIQEARAENFSLHFCVPTFMLLDYEISNYYGDGVGFVSSTFGVTRSFARRRLSHFKRQIQLSKYDSEVRKRMNNYKKGYDPEKWTDETKRIMNQLHQQIGEKEGQYNVVKE